MFKETASGARNNRLARNRALELAQARRIDTVLVTELSRWGRSTQDLHNTLYKLVGWKVSVIAQFERDLLSETRPSPGIWWCSTKPIMHAAARRERPVRAGRTPCSG